MKNFLAAVFEKIEKFQHNNNQTKLYRALFSSRLKKLLSIKYGLKSLHVYIYKSLHAYIYKQVNIYTCMRRI